MTQEISRRLVDGEWKTEAVDAGGGGSAAVLSASVTLTDTQIKNRTAVEIVAAPGIAKAIVGPVVAGAAGAIWAAMDWHADYADVSAAPGSGLRIVYGAENGDFTVGDYAFPNTANPLTWGAKSFWVGHNDGFPSATETFDRSPGFSFENQPLKVQIFNSDGNLTGGDAANTLAVTVLYSVIDLP